MTDPRCERLDDYLCGWLSPDDTADFEVHLADCSICQAEAALQAQIDRALAAEKETVNFKPLPVALAGRIERGIQIARRRRLFGWAGAMTAAAILFAIGLWGAQNVFFSRNDGQPLAHTPAVPANAPEREAPSVPFEPPSATTVRVTLVDPSSGIIVPVESHSPSVTLVCVYPTMKTGPENQSQTVQ